MLQIFIRRLLCTLFFLEKSGCLSTSHTFAEEFPKKLKLWETVRLSFVVQKLRTNCFMLHYVNSNLKQWHLSMEPQFTIT
jgi:hypothetical protein